MAVSLTVVVSSRCLLAVDYAHYIEAHERCNAVTVGSIICKRYTKISSYFVFEYVFFLCSLELVKLLRDVIMGTNQNDKVTHFTTTEVHQQQLCR